MLTFTWLPKQEKDLWLPKLFDLLYANMSQIAPEDAPYEAQKAQWLAQVSPALEKEPRQILMCLSEGAPVGYIQYYTRQALLMVEEVQVARPFQRTTVFFSLCRRLGESLSPQIRVIEAYADRRNTASLGLMQRLGMAPIPDGSDARFVHLGGSADAARKLFF